VDGHAVTVGAFYRSPNNSVENNSKLLSLLDSINSKITGKLLLVGDFNPPNINWLNHTIENNSSTNSTA